MNQQLPGQLSPVPQPRKPGRLKRLFRSPTRLLEALFDNMHKVLAWSIGILLLVSALYFADLLLHLVYKICEKGKPLIDEWFK